MDLLSDVLRGLRLRGAVIGMNEFRAPWGFDKPRIKGAAPFHVIVEGSCLFSTPTGELIALGPGDMVVVCHGEPHGLQADALSIRIPFPQLLLEAGIPSAWSIDSRMEPLERRCFGGNGASTLILSGIFTFNKTGQNPLLSSLPPVIRALVADSGQAGGIVGLNQMIAEAQTGRPGFRSIAERMAEVLFVQAVRDYITSMPEETIGWLRGLTDPRIARVLSLIHAQPATAWTIASLAKEASLSRTVLANRFQRLVGAGVIAYLTAQRMYVAAEMLTNTRQPLVTIANAVCYESEISFSRAFREWAGVPPGKYRRMSADVSAA